MSTSLYRDVIYGRPKFQNGESTILGQQWRHQRNNHIWKITSDKRITFSIQNNFSTFTPRDKSEMLKPLPKIVKSGLLGHHAYAHTHTNTHTHNLPLSPSLSLSLSLSPFLSLFISLSRSHFISLFLSYTQTHRQTYTHTLSLMQTHSQIITDTHTPGVNPTKLSFFRFSDFRC